MNVKTLGPNGPRIFKWIKPRYCMNGFKQWLEALDRVTFPQAMKIFGYKDGDVVDPNSHKDRYRKLSMAHHPDRNPGDLGAENRFTDVRASYERLSDFLGKRLPYQGDPETARDFQGQAHNPWNAQKSSHTATANTNPNPGNSWEHVQEMFRDCDELITMTEMKSKVRGKKDFSELNNLLHFDGSFYSNNCALMKLKSAVKNSVSEDQYRTFSHKMNDLIFAITTFRNNPPHNHKLFMRIKQSFHELYDLTIQMKP
jgi:hypothetical protein